MLDRFTLLALLVAGLTVATMAPSRAGPTAAPSDADLVGTDGVFQLAQAETTTPRLILPRPLLDTEVEIRADRSRHFTVEAEIEGRRVSFVVDTGATIIALTAETARRLNIRPRSSDFTIPVSTANGQTLTALVHLDEVRIEDIVVRDLWALVHRDDSLDVNLLGMNFLSELGSFEMRGDRLTLSQ